jgi:signal transduction histidine kinase
VIEVVRPALSRVGYHVDVLPPGRSVLTGIRLLNPTLVFLDWDSSGAPGLEPGQALTVIRERTAIPVWVITADDSSAGLTGVLEAGATGCLRRTHLAYDVGAWVDQAIQSQSLEFLEDRESHRREAEHVHHLMVDALGHLASLPDTFSATLDWEGKILTHSPSFTERLGVTAGESMSIFDVVAPEDGTHFSTALARLRSPDRGATFVQGQLRPVSAASRPDRPRPPEAGRAGIDTVGVLLRGEPDAADTSPIHLVLMDTAAPEVADRVLGYLGHLDGLVGRLQTASHAFRNMMWLLEVQARLLEAAPSPEDLEMVAEHLHRVAREGREFTELLSQPGGPANQDPVAHHRVRRRQHEPTPLVDAVHYLGSLLRRVFPDRITLRVDVADSLRSATSGARVPLRPSELRRCLLHLMMNARDAIEGPGRIDVRVEASELLADGLAVVVQDSGCGIPEAHLAKVFDPTFTTRPDRAGMGLGLAVVRTLMTRSGGQVIVTSVEGQGSRIELHFPPVPMA